MKATIISNGRTKALYVDGSLVSEARDMTDSDILTHLLESVTYARTKRYRTPGDEFPQDLKDVYLG